MRRPTTLVSIFLCAVGMAHPQKVTKPASSATVKKPEVKLGQGEKSQTTASQIEQAQLQTSERTGENRKDPKDSNRAQADWWVAAFTASLSLFTLALVVVSYFQYRTLGKHEEWMRRNVEVVEQIARAAADSAQTAKESLSVTGQGLRTSNDAALANAKAAQLHAEAVLNAERPWVVVRRGASTRSEILPLVAENHGRTPADIVSCEVEWTIVGDEMRELSTPPHYPNRPLPYRTLMAPHQPPWEFDVVRVNDILNRQSGPGVRQGVGHLLVYGRVRYFDMLNQSQEHETRFCLRYDPADNSTRSSGPEEYNQRT